MNRLNHSYRRGRRRGVALYLFFLSLPVLIGTTALVVDLGTLYTKHAKMQRAADAAALAGAINSDMVTEGTSDPGAVTAADDYATRNGYTTSTAPPTTVLVTPRVHGTKGVVGVKITRQEPLLFAPVMDVLVNASPVFSRNISAYAEAQLSKSLSMPISTLYGVADPTKSPTNLSAFGPYSQHDFGDPVSTKYYTNGKPNDGSDPTQESKYNPNGFSYTLKLDPQKFPNGDVAVQIYDPDCYNPGGVQYSWDEMHSPNPALYPGSPTNDAATTTVYEVYKTSSNGTVKQVATATYGADPSTNEKWVTPNGFKFNVAGDQPGDTYQIRVHTTDGSSENGYSLRAGPAEDASLPDDQWNQKDGDVGGTNAANIKAPITADSLLELNFTQSGQVKINLGAVPASLAGSTLSITKFDVDVGSKSITYTSDDPALAGKSYPGTIPQQANDVWSTDTIQVPKNYTGGNWYAEYTAGAGDTSTWLLAGGASGSGSVRLTK